ncbi:CMP-sialic acid transporter 5 [Hibiscus syriacus]|uniref:CMP-sialic acid transporter 5 n=1 Tax=Hibiscus syriacus TaxID=106335 RepID=A0A6A3BUR0_HIBSY|nr:CMP-sialic acid transporter 5 [Hibiscus syriacus]
MWLRPCARVTTIFSDAKRERKRKHSDLISVIRQENHQISKSRINLETLNKKTRSFVKVAIIVNSSVLTCEVAKVVRAIILMAKDGSLKKLSKEWTLMGSLTASGRPAAIYALRNSLLQISYRNLDSLTFSMLNQRKIIFTALFTFIILRQRQSIHQLGALFLLIMAALLLSIDEGSSKASSSGDPEQILFYGFVPVLVGSVLSGLAFIMSMGFSVVANALGGILVGLITSLAGGVTKGFVVVSAMLQFLLEGKPPSMYSLVALPLVIISISIYQKYPYGVKKKEA